MIILYGMLCYVSGKLICTYMFILSLGQLSPTYESAHTVSYYSYTSISSMGLYNMCQYNIYVSCPMFADRFKRLQHYKRNFWVQSTHKSIGGNTQIYNYSRN